MILWNWIFVTSLSEALLCHIVIHLTFDINVDYVTIFPDSYVLCTVLFIEILVADKFEKVAENFHNYIFQDILVKVASGSHNSNQWNS